MDTRFSSKMGSLKYLPLSNVLYAYGKFDGTTILIQHNNTIYIKDMMEYLLENTLQSDDNGIYVDIRPRNYYPGDSGSQTVTLPYGTTIPILYDVVLPYIPGHRPAPG